MKLYQHPLYREDVKRVAALPLPWDRLRNRTALISGATGLIGSFLTDVLMEKNRAEGLNCAVLALSRTEEKAKARFAPWWENALFRFIPYDVNRPLDPSDAEKTDFVLHLASNTHPLQYATDPIGTVTTNIIGLQNMLEFACAHGCVRMVFASSNEIYGENRGDTELFGEDYCGYIDCNTLRAGYPESKRCGEALCQAYIRQKGMDIVIPRLTRSYGPSMLSTDSKAVSQFIRKAVAGEDIVLKSAGTQYYSFTYMADAVSGLLTALLLGQCGEAYNVADESGDITLRDLAALIAGQAGRKVVFELPDATESAGYSKATKARLDGKKLRALGWRPMWDLPSGVERTVRVLREIE